MHSRGSHMTRPVWIYVPSVPPWHRGPSRAEPHQGSQSPVTAQESPVASQAAPERWPCSLSRPQPPQPSGTHATALSRHRFSSPPFCPLGFPASSLFWAQHGQICGDKSTQQPVGNVGVEQASRNERPAGRGEGCQEGSLITGLSVLISHRAWA